MTGDTKWTLDPVYPIRVEMSSVVDPVTVKPYRFESYLKRRWMRHESTILFDYDKSQARHELPGDQAETVAITPGIQDGVSMLYYARTLPFQLGKEIPLQIAANGKNWDLKGKVVQAHLIRIGRLGEWPAVEGEIELAYPVPFFHGAKARVWYSADRQRIPLLAKISSRIGPVTVVLTDRTLADSPTAQPAPAPLEAPIAGLTPAPVKVNRNQ
ncbi:MAG: hypothetical protein COV76_03000 [Candidatus Omnitrophica bacterium CG11_big_fil_rev_8_21_14_0_20_64_10]|nr:MAG: hypothetical protein COV76_03000 [Candidatus Omnitrophica bacterium CG11_big_fil_rev_8_21_14_0_20_64_10]